MRVLVRVIRELDDSVWGDALGVVFLFAGVYGMLFLGVLFA